MRISHKAVQSIGVVVSLVLASISFYLSVIDRMSQKEHLTVSGIAEGHWYPSKLYVHNGRLYFDARYNVLVSNNSNTSVSVVKLNGYFKEKKDGKVSQEPFHIHYVEGDRSTFVPINLAGWQSQMVTVRLMFPLSNDCFFEELSLNREVTLNAVVEIFSKHQKTFPMCRTVSSDGVENPKDYFFDRFSGPYFQVTTARGSPYESRGFQIVETYIGEMGRELGKKKYP